MDSDDEIRRLILKNASSDVIREAARHAGMRTLAEDGWRLVRLGITTVEEVLSVTTAKEVERATKKESPEGAAKEPAVRAAH
jgi:type IV pilus assembly protein PilB